MVLAVCTLSLSLLWYLTLFYNISLHLPLMMSHSQFLPFSLNNTFSILNISLSVCLSHSLFLFLSLYSHSPYFLVFVLFFAYFGCIFLFLSLSLSLSHKHSVSVIFFSPILDIYPSSSHSHSLSLYSYSLRQSLHLSLSLSHPHTHTFSLLRNQYFPTHIGYTVSR